MKIKLLVYGKKPVLSCENLIEARNIVNNYSKTHGASVFAGALVYDNEKFVARISYNGRLWDNEKQDDWQIAKEIII